MLDQVSKPEVESSLRKILDSRTFSNAERLRAFLSFVVEQTLAGQSESLKETTIGTVVFKRPAGYDNKSDTIVRAAARRLRAKLEEYYASEGADDPLRIVLTSGHYVPTFAPWPAVPKAAHEEPAQSSDSLSSIPVVARGASPRRSRSWAYFIGGCALAIAILIILLAHTGRSGETSWHSVPFTLGQGVQQFPALSPDSKQVAFDWQPPGEMHAGVYLQTVGQQNARLLVGGPEDNIRPTWSPDGQTIAFVRIDKQGQRAIYTTPVEGGPQRLVARLNGGPLWLCMVPRLSWSPDGTSLVSVERVGAEQACSIVRIDLRYGTKHVLTRPPEGVLADVEPAFSPDGRSVAFMRHATASSDTDVFLAPASGGEPRRLTHDHAELRGLTWMPDGKALIIVSSRDGGFLNLWRLPTEGGPLVKLTEAPIHLGFPSMAGSADRAAYVAYHYDLNIWKLSNAAGKSAAPREIVDAPGLDAYARYSPDGKRIAFISNRTGSVGNLWIASEDGAHLQQLTHFRTSPVGSPAWSPDGRWLAFDLQQNGKAEVYVMRAAAGQEPRLLTTEGGNNVLPCWSADGRYIFFGGFRSGVWNVYRIAAQGGAGEQVTQRGGQRSVVSADGAWLYFSGAEGGEIRRLPLNKAGPEESVLPASWSVPSIAWTVGEQGLYFITSPANKAPGIASSIKFADLNGRNIKTLADTPKNVQDLTVSPDGQTILYSQLDGDGSDILLLER